MARMHADELAIDEALAQRLVAEQFPDWAELPIARVEPAGTDNAVFRLGEELALRLPRRGRTTVRGDVEHRWLPTLARRTTRRGSARVAGPSPTPWGR
jgi:aminoglycoside phosphotransferase (APT) family kinase protein